MARGVDLSGIVVRCGGCGKSDKTEIDRVVSAMRLRLFCNRCQRGMEAPWEDVRHEGALHAFLDRFARPLRLPHKKSPDSATWQEELDCFIEGAFRNGEDVMVRLEPGGWCRVEAETQRLDDIMPHLETRRIVAEACKRFRGSDGYSAEDAMELISFDLDGGTTLISPKVRSFLFGPESTSPMFDRIRLPGRREGVASFPKRKSDEK